MHSSSSANNHLLLKTPTLMRVLMVFMIAHMGLLFANKDPNKTLKAGVDYRLISATKTPQQPAEQIKLFLWYGCETCLQLEQKLKQQAPESTSWTRLPANLLPNWRTSSKTFFVLRQLQQPFAMDVQLMEASHHLGPRFNQVDAISSFLANLGVDKKRFLASYHSIEINNQIKTAKQYEKDISLTKIPAAVIEGKFLVDITMVRSLDEFIQRIRVLSKLSETAPTTP